MHMRKGTKVVITVIFIFTLVIGITLFAGANYLYNFALNPTSQRDVFSIASSDVDRNETSGEVTELEKSKLVSESTDVMLTSFDGLNLHAFLRKNDTAGHRYAILVHGYKGEAASMASFAENFYTMNFHILAPDLRGHGYSEGDYIGMGWHDRLDIMEWIDWIIRQDSEAEIILFGISMGGATVMMTAGEELPENVKLIIEDCGYTSVWDEFKEQLKQMFGLPPFPILNIASALTKSRANFDFTKASAVEQLKKAKIPMLFIHGDKDTFVPYWMLDVVYEAAACEKEKLVIKGAEHAKSAAHEPELYWSSVEQFIKKYMN